MKATKVNRYGHAGKNPGEKEAYRQFLASKFYLDKTENDPVDTSKTDESSFEDEEINRVKVQKKSTWLKIKDFMHNNWVITIGGGFIVAAVVAAVGGYITLNSKQAVQEERIITIQKTLGDLQEENKRDFGNYNA